MSTGGPPKPPPTPPTPDGGRVAARTAADRLREIAEELADIAKQVDWEGPLHGKKGDHD